jgi:hypothetical protein
MVKLSLCLVKHHAMKTYVGVEVELHTILVSAIHGGEWSVSRPGHFNIRERAPDIPWIGGWMGPRIFLGAVASTSAGS